MLRDQRIDYWWWNGSEDDEIHVVLVKTSANVKLAKAGAHVLGSVELCGNNSYPRFLFLFAADVLSPRGTTKGGDLKSMRYDRVFGRVGDRNPAGSRRDHSGIMAGHQPNLLRSLISRKNVSLPANKTRT